MGLNQIIFCIMGISALIGGIDRITGCHLRLGNKFDEGFYCLGELALGMTGMLCLSPVLSSLLEILFSGFFDLINMDLSVLASVFCVDMGGFSLGMELGQNMDAAYFNGLFSSAMLGCTLMFTIPVAFNSIEKEDILYFSHGLLYGVAAIPVGVIASGLFAGFPVMLIIRNSIFIILVSIIVILGLKAAPNRMVKACIALGKAITALSYIGLTAAAFQYITGFAIIKGMTPIEEAMEVVASCGIMLLGTFPLLELLTRLLRSPLYFIGKKLGINEVASKGLIYSLANSVPVYKQMSAMDKKGAIINTAWLVCATASLGDHLAFASSVAPEYLVSLIAGKLIGGIVGVLLALNMGGKKK